MCVRMQRKTLAKVRAEHRLPGWGRGQEVLKANARLAVMFSPLTREHVCTPCLRGLKCWHGRAPSHLQGWSSLEEVMTGNTLCPEAGPWLPSVYPSMFYPVTGPGELIYFITFSRKSSPSKKPTKGVSDLLFWLWIKNVLFKLPPGNSIVCLLRSFFPPQKYLTGAFSPTSKMTRVETWKKSWCLCCRWAGRGLTDFMILGDSTWQHSAMLEKAR